MIAIDATDTAPPYEQLRRQITKQVESGELQPGDRLPTVRRLAGDLKLAPNTVARAYRELEAAGVIETRGRGGSFVMGDEVERSARSAAAEYLARTKALGLTPAEALQLVSRLAK
ncbi:MAG: GntR family transcriptional regulator [Nocardioidaceae bacterium]